VSGGAHAQNVVASWIQLGPGSSPTALANGQYGDQPTSLTPTILARAVISGGACPDLLVDGSVSVCLHQWQGRLSGVFRQPLGDGAGEFAGWYRDGDVPAAGGVAAHEYVTGCSDPTNPNFETWAVNSSPPSRPDRSLS